MQPTYLPWAGFFNLISKVDVFVFLDDVQYEKTSWQNRNRVLVNGQPHWISVPAMRENLSQRINEVVIDDRQPWRKKHFRLIEQSYAKKPHASEMLEIVRPILDTKLSRLVDLNIMLLSRFCEKLALRPHFARTSDLGIEGQRSQRLINICQHFECDEYLSPVGSADYLAQDGHFTRSTVRLSFQNYTPVPYGQGQNQPFVSHLSIVDLYANLGAEETKCYVRGSTYENEKNRAQNS